MPTNIDRPSLRALALRVLAKSGTAGGTVAGQSSEENGAVPFEVSYGQFRGGTGETEPNQIDNSNVPVSCSLGTGTLGQHASTRTNLTYEMQSNRDSARDNRGTPKPVDRMSFAEIEAELRCYQPMTSLQVIHDETRKRRRSCLWQRLDALVATGLAKPRW